MSITHVAGYIAIGIVAPFALVAFAAWCLAFGCPYVFGKVDK